MTPDLPDNFDLAVTRITEVVLREGECMVRDVPEELHQPLRRAIIKAVKAQIGGTMITRSWGTHSVWAHSPLANEARSEEQVQASQAMLMRVMEPKTDEEAAEEAAANAARWQLRWFDALAY